MYKPDIMNKLADMIVTNIILESVVTFKLNFDVDAILLPRGFNLEPVLCIFTQNYGGWGHKIFKLHFLPENAKKHVNF